MVDHLLSTHNAGIDDDFGPRDRTLTDDADIERATIGLLRRRAKIIDTVAAVGARDEAEECRRLR